jgi:hypothetical protein
VSPTVTLVDVAARAGVSVGTVSNVLNRPATVRAPTRRVVDQAIAEPGYVPNVAARQLASGSSRTIAYVIFDVGNPYFADVSVHCRERLLVEGDCGWLREGREASQGDRRRSNSGTGGAHLVPNGTPGA